MKKSILLFSITLLLFFGSVNMSIAQDQPKSKKDTVNMDTDAKPTFYYATEDEKADSGKGGSATIGIIAGVVVIAAAAGFFLLKKKKK